VTNNVTIRRIRPVDAARARALRLEMLADTPLAFLTTLAQAAAKPHAEFCTRVMRAAAGPTAGHFVADTGDRLVGQVLGMESRTEPGATLLLAVYVSPDHRGRGLTGAMVDAVGAWSHAHGRDRLELEVITNNMRARRAYRKIGFVDHGAPVSHPTIPVLTEQVMIRDL